MKVIKYIAILFFLIGTSCANQKNEKMFAVDLTALTNDTIYYTSFVDSLSYITLETKDECLIGEITDAILTDEYIFILDLQQQTVWVFNSLGKYSHSICHKGNGPGEYANLTQFEFDTTNNELLLLDGWTGTILRYSLNGDFINKTKFTLYPSDFKETSDGYLLSLLGAPDTIGGVFHYDIQTKQYKQLIKRSTNLSCNFSWEMVSFDDTIAFMAPPFDNMVYHSYAGKTYEFLPLQILPLPTQKYEYTSSKQNLPDFIRTNYIEGRNWIYATYWCAKYDLRVFLYNKKKQSYKVALELVNDIDGIDFTYVTSACNNNQYVFGYLDDNQNPTLQILHLKP